MSFPRDMILGEGVFSYGEALTTSSLTDIGASRGGGNFNVTRTYRKREADGDFGFVKGRIAIDDEVATLTVRALEMLPGAFDDFHPAMNSSAGASTTTITSLLAIADGDYKKVAWTGVTDGGNAVVITLDNAINMNDINLDLIDKDEVIDELVYTSCSLEATTSTPSWKIEFTTT